ncbi:MAG: hypothetical protein CME56_04755 [Halieaceae bacterium]|nr:hypothetical protein [Halieaceae bacterium]
MELTLDKALQQAVAAHRESKLQEAERLYRAILQAHPNHPDANHNLGVLAVTVGKPLEAIPLFKLALETNPQIEQFWLSYIDALIKVEFFDDAEHVVVEGEKVGVSSDKLDGLKQRLYGRANNDANKSTKGLKLSEKRKKLAEKKKSKKTNARSSSPRAEPSQDQIKRLLVHYQAGRLEEAEVLATSLTQQIPSHPFGWKVLGAVQKQAGRLSESLESAQIAINLSPQDSQLHSNLGNTLQGLGRLHEAEASHRQAIRLKPDFAEAHSNLGVTLQELGRLEEAEASLRQAIAMKPDYAKAHNNLANTLQELGRLEEAEASLRQAIAFKPDYANAHRNLGKTLQELGRLDDAEASYRKATALKLDFAEAHSNLGNTLQELGRLHEAEASHRQAIALKPDLAEAHSNLGNALQELGRLHEAEASHRQAIALKPNFAEAHSNLGNTLQELGRLDEAEASYRQAIIMKPDYGEAHSNLGTTLKKVGRLDEAEAGHRQAIALNPDFAEAHNNLGVTLQELGRLDEAEASYRQAIIMKPDYAEAHSNLAGIKKFLSRDEQFLQMQELYEGLAISEQNRCHICFALAKACEDLRDFARAFRLYAEGSALRKKHLGYDKVQDQKLFEKLKANFSRIAAHTFEPEIVAAEPIPVFILGLPRSGTSLVEQIISSHPLVTGAGELPFVSQFGGSLAVGQAPVNAEALTTFRETYLAALNQRSEGKAIVTDKMPQNFRFLGLISAALPEAKIIHVSRDPAAVCWANYRQYFSDDSMRYCYSLDDILHYHRLYEDLMKFWHNALPNTVYDLDYEALTEHQEEETRKLIAHLGLVWDDACLSPQDNKRGVSTASNVQVRQKVYQGSSEKWKRYKPYLNGALDHFSAGKN